MSGVRFKTPGGGPSRASRHFGLYAHYGNGLDDLPGVIREHVDADKFRRQQKSHSWVLVADGETYLGRPPTSISWAEEDVAGFMFGGPEAHLEILNQTYTARESFKVKHKDGYWETTVDGEVVESGEFHPFYIWWSKTGSDKGGWL